MAKAGDRRAAGAPGSPRGANEAATGLLLSYDSLRFDVFPGEDVLHRSDASDLKFAFRAWQAIATREQPAYAQMHHLLRRFDRFALLLEPDGDDLYYLHMGQGIVEEIGLDMTGRYLSEMPGELMPHLRDMTAEVIARFVPRYARNISTFEDRTLFWERVVLPVRRSGRSGDVLALSVVAPLSTVSQILHAVFRESPFATLVAVPIHDEGGRIVDGWVVLANESARRRIGHDPKAEQDRRVRARRSLFADDRLWSRLVPDGKPCDTAVPFRLNDADMIACARTVGEYLVLRVLEVGARTTDIFLID
jgi:hypothetical protein